MFILGECTENVLCVDCKDTRCTLAGKIMSDCPKYHCDRDKDHIDDCETCEFIKDFQEKARKQYNIG